MPYRDFVDIVADIRRTLPPHEGRSLVEEVARHLSGPTTGLEEPVWTLAVEVIAAEANNPSDDDEARQALSAYARRSDLRHARRAQAAEHRLRRGCRRGSR